MRTSHNSFATIGLFGVVVVGFGTAFAQNSVVVSGIPPLWARAIQATVACLIFTILASATKRSVTRKPRDFKGYAVIGKTAGIIPFFVGSGPSNRSRFVRRGAFCQRTVYDTLHLMAHCRGTPSIVPKDHGCDLGSVRRHCRESHSRGIIKSSDDRSGRHPCILPYWSKWAPERTFSAWSMKGRCAGRSCH